MTADRWTQAVRHQLGIGRLLPLGDAHDGAWIAERAVEAVLRSAARDAPGVRLDALRVAVADTADTAEPAVPAPPSALPPGPLRVTAEFAATASQPLPTTASLLRATLATAATQRLGLTVTEVDLRVTGLLDEEAPATAGPGEGLPEPPRAARAEGGDEARVADAALGVPGVLRLTGTLGHPVHIEELPGEGAALPHRHVRLELAVGADQRARDVAREVRTVVRRTLPDHPAVAVVVSAIG
ncbi:nucleopolyhedrovirus P10 family protein [Streptomyces cahuitamycinicus]|uniref:Nucleopolyhedrovirus P10 family protein n=1 Tax=Streptomyces cahuitamycinicus TaxID=2070367 RepID=A0A2N8TV57_9ACTN|nr:nucleopolyhedrovirus P10 family protein [Streptomyces cahuitamycinicus]PNG22905.1 nucleopolyhedrovirus P10 family protein [Streptomyces cahuitamycinicus]